MTELPPPTPAVIAPETDSRHLYNRKSLTASILTLLSGSVISQGLTALVLLFAAREVGPEQYGQYASAIVLATFLSILFSLGLDIWLLREGGAHPHQLGSLAAGVLGIKLGFGVVWILLMLILARHLPSGDFSPQIFRLAVLVVWLDSLLNTIQTLFKAALKNLITSSLMIASDLAWFLGTITLALRNQLDASTFMELRVVILGITVLAGGLVFARLYKPQIDKGVFSRITTEFFPYAVSDLLVLAILRADVLVISLTLGTKAVGLYVPALSFVNAIYLILDSVHGVMLPVLSNLFSNQVSRAWSASKKVIIIQTSIGLLLSLSLFLASPFLVMLLGQKYRASLEIIRILSFNLVFRGLSFAMVSILLATRQQARRTVIQTIGVIFNVVLNIIVVFWLGIRGVAFVYVLTEAVMAGGYGLLVYMQKHPSGRMTRGEKLGENH